MKHFRKMAKIGNKNKNENFEKIQKLDTKNKKFKNIKTKFLKKFDKLRNAKKFR